MNEDDDFTFCQVAPMDETSAPGVIHLAHAVSGMSLGDKNLSPLWMDKLEDGSASANQSVFGSLTFNVGDGKFKAPPVEENTSDVTKAAPRAKVPFEKGLQSDGLAQAQSDSSRPHRIEGKFQQKTCIYG